MNRLIGYLLAASMLAFGILGVTGAQAQSNTLPQEMLGVTWELVAIEGASQPAENVTGAGITLEFSGDVRLSGFGGCNGFGGIYKAGPGETLDIDEIISTLRACLDNNATEREARYFGLLDKVTAYTLAGDTLTLTSGSGADQATLRYTKGGTTAPTTPGMPRTGEGTILLPFLALFTAVMLLSGLALRHVRRVS